jgi:hypothetical protein
MRVPGHGDQSTITGRQISPEDETEATCLLAGQHSRESFGWTRRPPRPSVPAGRLHPEQTTKHHPHHGRFVRAFLWDCSPWRIFVICVIVCYLSRLCCGDKYTKTGGRATCLGVQAHSRAARGARLCDLPHQTATIEFSSSFCAVGKRLGATGEATGMGGLGKVGGPSRLPMRPCGVIDR